MKKLVSLVLALALVLASCAIAVAAPTAFTTGTITVKNAAKGETYFAIKAIDAIVSEDGITYSTTIPDELSGVFGVTTKTVDVMKDGVKVGERKYQIVEAKTEDKAAIQAAMRAYADNHMPTSGGIECTGNSVKFTGLEPGYYVIISTLNNKLTNKVSAGSTYNGDGEGMTPHTADGVVYEKNETIPQPDKTVDDKSYSIGDTITYTVSFPGANYIGSGDAAEIVTKYRVQDTLPDFLSNVALTHVYIGGSKESPDTTTDYATNEMKTSFVANKYFDIDWATKGEGAHDWTSKYTNGTIVTVQYTAKLTKVVNVNADNTNTVTIIPFVDRPDGPTPYEKPWSDSEKITTYAAALKKVDENGNALAGAKFKFTGLQTVPTVEGEVGNYTVVSTTAAAADETEMEVGADGMLYIVGLKENKTLTGTETKAPDGYNLLTSTFTVTPQKMTEEIYSSSGVRYYDADDNLLGETKTSSVSKNVVKNLSDLNADAVQVINNKGTELPHTGGIGTTIFYILGGLLVIGAAVILVARRKAQD